MKKPDLIIHIHTITAVLAGALLLLAVLPMVLFALHPLLGILFAIAGALVLTYFARKFYISLTTSNLELERACRTRLLEKYLSGDVPPEGDLTEAMPGITSEYFAVATIQCIDFSGYLPTCTQEHIPHPDFMLVDNWMRDYVTTRLRGISMPYFVPITDGMEVLINVTGLDQSRLDESSREKVEEICQALSLSSQDLQKHGLVCGAVVSTVYCGRENIVKAKREADELTAYAELMGDNSPVKNGYEHAELPIELSDKMLRTELEKSFMQSLTNRNFSQLEKTMEGLMDLELRTAARYPDLFKNRLMSHMEQMLSAFSISVVDYDAEEAVVVNQFRTLWDTNSAQQLRQGCRDLISILKSYVEAESGQRSDKVEKALDFIQQHFDDPSIGADMIGDALGLSASYVSRLLRQNTGMGVVDYIHSARLKKAKELLANTDLSVDDIATTVGFSSRWTLTRSFKRYEETTPGAFREGAQRNI